MRALLILLAQDSGRVVPADSLIARLWDADPPAGARSALQSLVSRLRAALVSAGVDREVIESGPTGYRLALPPDAVDANRFEPLAVAGGRALADSHPAEAARRLRDALSLWQGPALADAAGTGFAAGPAARLEELRASAAADLIDANLALGFGEGLAGELQAAVAADPLAERQRAQLMRVLYAAGRQADALAVYEDSRRLLADELGVDPSPQLQEVHLAVLRQDLAMARPAAAGVLFAGLALNQGRYDEAALTSEEAIAAFRGLGDRWGLAMALMTLAEQAGMRGDHDGAITALEDAVAVSSPGPSARTGPTSMASSQSSGCARVTTKARPRT